MSERLPQLIFSASPDQSFCGMFFEKSPFGEDFSSFYFTLNNNFLNQKLGISQALFIAEIFTP